jgi:signal peptidase I
MYWKIFKVSGDSMSPTIVDGDYVLARKFKTKPANGSIAVIQHPSLGRKTMRQNKGE